MEREGGREGAVVLCQHSYINLIYALSLFFLSVSHTRACTRRHSHTHTHTHSRERSHTRDPSCQQLEPFKLIGRAAAMWAGPVSEVTSSEQRLNKHLRIFYRLFLV